MKKRRTWSWLYFLEKSKDESHHAIFSTNKGDITKTVSIHKSTFFRFHTLAGTTRFTLCWIEIKSIDSTPFF